MLVIGLPNAAALLLLAYRLLHCTCRGEQCSSAADTVAAHQLRRGQDPSLQANALERDPFCKPFPGGIYTP